MLFSLKIAKSFFSAEKIQFFSLGFSFKTTHLISLSSNLQITESYSSLQLIVKAYLSS
jgi:hypothetical protein